MTPTSPIPPSSSSILPPSRATSLAYPYPYSRSIVSRDRLFYARRVYEIQIRASSCKDGCQPSDGRLFETSALGAWCPREDDEDQYLEIDLGYEY
jgi:hypothetical protein